MSPEGRIQHGVDPTAAHRVLALVLGVLAVVILGGGPRTRKRSPPAANAPRLASFESRHRAPTASPSAGVPSPGASAPAVAPRLGAPPASSAASACSEGMVLVEGDYCTNVEHDCKRWLDDPQLPYARCGEYTPPARCVGKRVKLRFCIDRLEYTRPGEQLPQNYGSFAEAVQLCGQVGKRICNESEWNFACEGPDMLPYPYGWRREPVCNQDRTDLYETNPSKQVLKDWRQPSGAAAGCKSPFGVYDMAGNLDEPVLREAQQYAYPFRNGLKGGWWMPARNRCRPSTTAHDDHYRDIQVGIRCCRDATPA